MEVNDVSDEAPFRVLMQKIQDAAEKAAQRKGQMVSDHPSVEELIWKHLLKLRYASLHVQGREHQILTTQVPAPYLPCIVSEKDLKPITISEMKLETHHRGRKVMLRVLTPPQRITAVMAIVEDENRTGVVLQLYHQPEETVVPANEIMGPDMVCILKEPFFKCATDGSYSLRVDHPSDIIWLSATDDRVPLHWQPKIVELNQDSKRIREKGNKAVEGEKWAEALRLYSSAIEAAQNPEEEQLASLNRSLANLRLGRPEKAASDAVQGANPETPSEKALFREARALYQCGDFELCLKKLQLLAESHPQNKAVKPELQRVNARLAEQRDGEYNFARMYKQATQMPPLIDCATFSKIVEVRNSPGRERGLFTTKAVKAGELLLCEKAFVYGYADPDGSKTKTHVLMNLSTKRITIGGQALAWTQAVQKLWHSPQVSAAMKDLYHGDYEAVPVLECDGAPVVDSFLMEKILSLNAFGAPRTTREWFLTDTSRLKDEALTTKFKTSGLWLLASRINHSCIDNCCRSFIGDIMIIRATQDMPADTELFHCYSYPVPGEPYENTQKRLKHWGFTCDCELCTIRKVARGPDLARRMEQLKIIHGMVEGLKEAGIPGVRRCMKNLEKTYQKKEVEGIRLELLEPCLALGASLLQAGRRRESVKIILKGLHAVGYKIIAYLPGDKAENQRLEVQKWGFVDNCIPWVFYNLFQVYRGVAPDLCPTAKRYVELAYGMVVGEEETCMAVFPNLHQGEETIEGIVEKIIIDEFEYSIKRCFNVYNAVENRRIPVIGLRNNKEKRFYKGCLYLQTSKLKEIFLKRLGSICALVDNQITAAMSRGHNVQKVVLIGGFAASRSLKEYLRRYLKSLKDDKKYEGCDITLLVPEQETVVNAVASGAVLRALDKSNGPVREARCSYGVIRTEQYGDRPEHQGAPYSVNRRNGGLYVSRTVDWVLKLGSAVPAVWEVRFLCVHGFATNAPRLVCREELYVSDTSFESHYKLTHKKNQGAEKVGEIVADFTFLRDQGLIQITRPVNEKGRRIGRVHYLVSYTMVIRVIDRDHECFAIYNDRITQKCRISIATGFQPGVQ